MIVILILATIPMGEIKLKLKHTFGVLTSLRLKLQKIFNTEIAFSTVQDILHVPFFGVLAFLWMYFFTKRNIQFQKALIYTLLITFAFSIFEESCQFFISRDASFGDLLLNFSGCIAGIAIFKLR